MSEHKQRKNVSEKSGRDEDVQRVSEVIGILAKIAEALEKGIVELYNIDINIDEVELKLPLQILETLPIPVAITPPPKAVAEAKPEVQAGVAVAKAVEVVGKKVVELMTLAFEEPKLKFVGKVVEVKLGATRSEGGTRVGALVLGGISYPLTYT